jgi:Ice-binding-like/PEP-CTERM motif
MRCRPLILLAIAALSGLPLQAKAGGILGTAQSFAVLASSTVTNTGPSVVGGDLGVSPGTAVVGFPPGSVTAPGTIHAGDAQAASAQADANTAFNGLAGMSPNSNLTGQDLGGLMLTSGVYKFDSSAQLTGTLTLDAQHLNNAYWVFQIGSTLTTASASSVNIINVGSNGGSDDGLFWQVGSSATLGTTTAFEGNILAQASITLNTGANIDNGRALALTAAVTMDTNTISIASPPPNNGPGLSEGLKFVDTPNGPMIVPIGLSAAPEPGTFVLFGSGLIGVLVLRKRLIKRV